LLEIHFALSKKLKIRNESSNNHNNILNINTTTTSNNNNNTYVFNPCNIVINTPDASNVEIYNSIFFLNDIRVCGLEDISEQKEMLKMLSEKYLFKVQHKQKQTNSGQDE